MIAVRLRGGLGNQLFQYAAGRALALHRKSELLLDRSWFSEPQGATPRSYALDVYPLSARRFDAERLRTDAGWLARLKKRAEPVTALLADAGWRVVRQDGRHYSQGWLDQHGERLYLDGYWQSEHFFRSARAALLAELTLPTPATGENAEVLAQIDSAQAVAVHIRRGDYVTDAHTHNHHGLCSLDYYREAFDELRAKLPDARPFVFSDDPEWTRAQLAAWPGVRFIDHNADRPHEDLRLMRHCKHFIVANSSFSWWGAWLSDAANKIVIAPRRWFADPAADEGKLVPEDWIRR